MTEPNNDTRETQEKKLEELLDMSRKLSGGDEPFDKNLFEMANLKEYRHSAILGYLLNRKEHGKRVHLKTFCSRLLGDRMSDLASEVNGDVKVSCEEDCGQHGRRRIDILVETTGFALIIENKCRGALDQEDQISDYWDGVKQRHQEKDMYVLYLPPMNSFAAPSDNSLGELKGRFSVGGDLAGHLMTYSYRDLVLPWLKEEVLPNINYGSGTLVDSLRCYIDLLEGMFAVRSDDRDMRLRAYKAFLKLLGQADPDPIDLWRRASKILDDIDKVLSCKMSASISIFEKDANMLGGLQSKLWEVRSVLREGNPLLDPPNLSREVYWMLRKHPTPFAAQCIRSTLDSGLFFQSGRKQSAWDCVEYEGHWLECVFHVDEFVKYHHGESCGAILTFGIGNVDEGGIPQLKEAYGETQLHYLKDSRWRWISVANEKFNAAKGAAGGVILWEIAKIVAKEAAEFSGLVGRVFGKAGL